VKSYACRSTSLGALILSSRLVRAHIAPSLQFLCPLSVTATFPGAIATHGLTQFSQEGERDMRVPSRAGVDTEAQRVILRKAKVVGRPRVHICKPIKRRRCMFELVRLSKRARASQNRFKPGLFWISLD
jgi:hypothetical protein